MKNAWLPRCILTLDDGKVPGRNGRTDYCTATVEVSKVGNVEVGLTIPTVVALGRRLSFNVEAFCATQVTYISSLIFEPRRRGDRVISPEIL